MVADRQTQRLPASEFERQRLAWSMGFHSWASYRAQLHRHRTNIHNQFRTILDAETSRPGDAEAAGLRLADLWKGKLTQSDAVKMLHTMGFAKAQSTPQLLRGFRQGRLYQAFSGVERDRLDRLMPRALQQAAEHAEAERAMAAFIGLIEAIGRRSVYPSLLIENPVALKQLLHLCAASPWISRHIGQHPVILDELLNPSVDIRTRTQRDLRIELEQQTGPGWK